VKPREEEGWGDRERVCERECVRKGEGEKEKKKEKEIKSGGERERDK